MIKSALAALLLATTVWAGETYLGTIAVLDGGIANNATTAVPFRIPKASPISSQCPTASIMGVNTPVVDAGTGIKLGVDQFFTSSTANNNVSTLLSDGGTYVGGVVSICPVAGAATAECKVYVRQGNE